MQEEKESLIETLNLQSELTVNAAASLNHETQELYNSVKRIRSTHEIKETIESILMFTRSIQTVEQNLKALRQRFNI